MIQLFNILLETLILLASLVLFLLHDFVLLLESRQLLQQRLSVGTSRELVHDLLCLCEHAQGVLQLFLQFGIIVIINFSVAKNIFVLGVISTVLSLRRLFLSFLAL